MGTALSLRTIEPGKIILALRDYQKFGIDGQRADYVSEYALRLLRGVFRMARRGDSAQDEELVEVFRSRDLEIIARAMRFHGKDGTLLVVRNYDKSLVDEMRYGVEPDETFKTYLATRDSVLREGRFAGDPEAFTEFLETIGQLTSIDGATIVTNDLCLVGFGAKTKRRSSAQPTKFRRIKPFEGAKPILRKDINWGTRHGSAAQFIFDDKDALAIVASQDGKLSMFVWDDAEQAVSVIEEAEFLLL